jgi:mannose-1-phosphate guanylyltransferase
MFFWRADTIRSALQQFLPATAAVLAQITASAGRGGGRDNKSLARALKQHYPRCENISIDYAVLEKASNVLGIPSDFGWSDVGSWNAVYDLLPRDAQSNVLRTPSLLIDAAGMLIDVPGKLVAGIGLQGLVIVETPDALLIADRRRSQEVSQLVKKLEELRRNDLL